MGKYENLTKRFPQFIYKKYEVRKKGKNLWIFYFFQIPKEFHFKTKILIKDIPDFKINDPLLKNLIFRLGLIEMLNYWKLTCSPIILVEAGSLSRGEVRFWKKVILNGMGQYFYENKINFTKRNFLKIRTKINDKNFSLKKLTPIFFGKTQKILVPLGGGKDSLVVLEMLKKKHFENLGLFLFNPKEHQIKIAKLSKVKEKIIAERKLDPLLLKLNQKGFLNGHVPFSAFLAFLAVILAYIFRYKKIAFAWEKSANIPNLKYRGKWINHQWSKSLEFEKLLNRYLEKFCLKGIKVFSPIRKMSDLKIAEEFAKLSQYHQYFISCNQVFKIKYRKKSWCGKCPKCLFVFASLYPFVGEKVIKIFKKNLFEDKKLLPLMLQLIGKKKFKPFECVGTVKESYLAFKMSVEKFKERKEKLPFLLKYFEKINCQQRFNRCEPLGIQPNRQ